MMFVIRRCYHRLRQTETIDGEDVFVASGRKTRIQDIVEVWIRDVDFVWAYADDWTCMGVSGRAGITGYIAQSNRIVREA